VDEFELIETYFRWPDGRADIIEGIGDDGAVLRPPPGMDLVTVVDTLVGNVHFPAGTDETSARSVGHRSVAVQIEGAFLTEDDVSAEEREANRGVIVIDIPDP